jgi:hypothetical protein
MSFTSYDINEDGDIDREEVFNKEGKNTSYNIDKDFINGFELFVIYLENNRILTMTDTNNNGYLEYVIK